VVSEFEKMAKAKLVLEKMARGIDPLTGEVISEENFLCDPRISRCFVFVAEVLENVINGVYSERVSKLEQFLITPEQKSQVNFTAGKIGLTEFTKCINACLNLNLSKKLTNVELSKRLKKMEILGENIGEKGKARTVTNENSAAYGFEMIKRSFEGKEYQMLVMNDQGKQYLLEHLEEIMSLQMN